VNTLVLANFVLAVLVITAIVGIPLWMTFKRPETAPDYTAARAYFRARARGARTLAVAGGPVRGMTPARPEVTRSAQPERVAA
jgi:hypothetical protein